MLCGMHVRHPLQHLRHAALVQGLQSADQLGPLALIGAGGLAGMSYWIPV